MRGYTLYYAIVWKIVDDIFSPISDISDNLETLTPQDSSWLIDTQPRDWFIGRVLKAWDRARTLTIQGASLMSSMKQLSSYAQSNLNENLSVKQVQDIGKLKNETMCVCVIKY